MALCGRYSKVSSHPETQVPIALIKAQGAPPLPSYNFSHHLFSQKQKTETPNMDISEKIYLHYDFLRRHYPYQVKGSKFDYFFSARLTSSPVFICFYYYTITLGTIQVFFRIMNYSLIQMLFYSFLQILVQLYFQLP